MKKNTIFSERLLKLIDYLAIKPNNFAKKLGYDRSQTVYDIINGKSMPSYDFFFRFINAGFSEIINVEWVIAGKGKMLKKENPISNSIVGDNSIIGDNNRQQRTGISNDRSIEDKNLTNIIKELKVQMESKDNIIDNLIKQQSILISKLTEKL
ncbi:MAG: hypothetical protein FWG84_02400 [Bacteroidales bacterium]|nr:hypothetical protein [Bacteroidales bacterium]